MRHIYIVILLCSLLFSCKSAQKYFDNGDYEKAYSSSLKDAKKGKRDRKTRTLLKRSFGELINENRTEVSSYLTSNMIEDWEYAYDKDGKLIRLYNDGKSYLNDDYDPRMQDIISEYDTLREDIVKNYLELAYLQMETYDASGDKLAAQEAHIMANRLIGKYRQLSPEIMSLAEEAKQAGTIHILVNTSSRYGYNYQIEREFNQITRESGEYIEVHYNTYLSEEDCVLNIEFGRIDEYSRDNDRTESYREEIEDGYTIERDTSGNEIRTPKYTTIEGEVRITERRTQYEWNIRVNVDDRNNYCDFRSRRFSVTDENSEEFYELYGDRRAIPQQYQDRRSRSNNRNPDDILDDMIEDSFDQIRRYYF